LPYSTPIVVRLNNSLSDICGTPLTTAANGVQLFSFTTAAVPVAPPAPPVVNPLSTALTNLPAVQLTGTAPPGTTVTVAGGASSVSGATGSGGLFSLSVPLVANQQNSFSVTAMDSAGHTSTAVTTDINGKTLTVQSDQIAPTVTATIPTNGATGVAVGSAISVAFSKPINTGTANTLNVVLTTGGVAVPGSVAGSGSALTFTPSAPLRTGTQYQLTVRAGGVSDLAGNTLASSYIVSFTTTPGTPTLTSVTPGTGTVGTTFPVTFTGTTLSAASGVLSGNAGIGGTITAAGASTVTASITISTSAAVGATTLGLVVGSTSLSVPFTVTAATPSVTSISPAAGTAGNTLSVTFTGTNLAAAKAVVSGNAGISGTISAASASSVTASITIAGTAAAGATTLGLTVGGANFSAPFTVIAAAPSVTSVTPASGIVGTTFPVTFVGTSLAGASAIASSNAGITGTITGTPTSTSVTASIAIAASATTGTTSLGVVIGGQTYSVNFAVNSATPTLTSIAPAAGAAGTTFSVTFAGTNLSGATAVVSGNPGVSGSITGAPTSTGVTAQIAITSAAATGATTLGIVVGGKTLSLAFTVNASTPTLTSISPNSGTVGTTVTVTFSGTNLTGATAVVSGNAGVSGTLVGTPTASSVTASVVIASTATTGATTLGLIVGGQTLTPLTFTVLANQPTITGLTPAFGLQGDAVVVLITGTNLLNITGISVSGTGVTATAAGGGSATSRSATVAIASTAATGARTLTVTTPAGSAIATFTVNPAVALSITLSPSPLTLSTESTASLTITLNAAAPTGGVVINLATGTGLVTFSTASVAIAQGQTSATVVAASTATTGSDTITASGTGVTSGTDSVQVQLRSFSLNAGLVGLSRVATGVITLNQPAPATGATIALSVANTSVATVSPSSVTIPSGQTIGTFTLTGGSTIGTTTLTANGSASGFGTQTATLTVTNQLLNLSTVQNLAFGEAGTYQVQIAPNAAPAGGVVVSLASSNTASATVPATVTIPAGAYAANFTVQADATATGTSTISASNANFAPTTTTVNVTAALALDETAKILASTQTDTVAFQLTSGGNLYNAPAGGVVVTGTSSNSSCVNLTSTSVTVPAGQSYGSLAIAYGSTATLPCTATVTLNNALFGTGSIPVTYQTASNLGTIAVSSVPDGLGNGLEVPVSVSLSTAAPTGGTTVEVSSSNPSLLLVSPSSTSIGAPAINVAFAAGSSSATVYLQGMVGSTGNVTLTAKSARYTTVTSTVAVVPSALYISYAPSLSTTVLTGSSAIGVGVAAVYSCGQPTSCLAGEVVGPQGGPVTVTASSSNPTVGELQTGTTDAATATAQIPVGSQYTNNTYYSGFSFVPLANGSTTVSVSAPGFASGPFNSGSYVTSEIYTVSDAALTLPSGVQVGGGLQVQMTGQLQAANDGGVTIRISSSDATKLLISPDGVQAGEPFINVFVNNGVTSYTFYAVGIAGATGTVTLTASTTDTSFTTGTTTVAVVEPTLEFYTGLPSSESATSGDAPFEVCPYVAGYSGCGGETVAAATPLVVTLASSNTGIASLTTSSQTQTSPVTVTVAAGAYASPSTVAGGGVALHAVATGTSTITATAPGTLSVSQTVTLD
jgi:hypothetical protein